MISCVFLFVCVIKQLTCLGWSSLDEVKEKTGLGLSPFCSSSFSKSMLALRILGGVPVLSLPVLGINSSSCSAKITDGLSPFLPPFVCLAPVCITPFKNVPTVSTRVLEKNLFPLSVTSPLISLFSIISFDAVASNTDRFCWSEIMVCIALL